MTHLNICCKDILDSIIDYFYPDEILKLKDILELSSLQLENYYKRNISIIPGSLSIRISDIIKNCYSTYEKLLIRLTYENKINKHDAIYIFSRLGDLNMVKYINDSWFFENQSVRINKLSYL